MLIIQFPCKCSEVGRVWDVSGELICRLFVWKVENAHDRIGATFLDDSRVLIAKLLGQCYNPPRVGEVGCRIVELAF